MTRRMLSWSFAAALLIAFSGAAAKAAQGDGGGRGQRIRAALAQLDLSAEQKQQIKKIVADARQQRQADGGADKTDKAAARQAARATMEKIMAVLTPAQKAKFKQILASERSRPTTQA